jgi:hypothetical protein
VAFLAAFGLGTLAGTVILLPLIVPVGLIWPAIRLYPLLIAKHLLWEIGALVLTVWVYRRVTAPAIHAAADQEPPDRRHFRVRPLCGLIAGVVLVAALAVGIRSMLHGEVAQRARAEAQRKTGAGYDYFVYQVLWEYVGGKKTTSAKVIAYNSREVRELKVAWEK